MKKILFFLLIPFISLSQVQIGQDIDGEAEGDLSGISVSLSSDGSIVAIGAVNNDGNGENSGHVRVYRNESSIWTQIGDDIDGEAIDDNFGSSVSLSSDGSIVAIGATNNDGNGSNSGHVRVYRNESDMWTQIGDDINGDVSGDLVGNVSLSSDGTILAVGAAQSTGSGDPNGSGPGRVRIYENIGGVWTQIGSDINGDLDDDAFGFDVSISSDGSIVAISGVLHNLATGHVRVYENIGGIWTQIGSDIDGEGSGDQFGRTISLSSNGSILAIGGILNDSPNGNLSGHVRVYENIGGIWTQIGSDIDGEAANDLSGTVSLSSDGSIVAIGGQWNDGNGDDSGHVRIYKNISGVWTQVGVDIDGEAAEDRLGISVSISNNGFIIAACAYTNDGNGENSGHVRIYDLNAVLSTESFKKDYFSFYPNPVKNVLNLDLNAGLDLKQVNIYNIQSQYLYSAKTSKIDIRKLSSGLYFIEVETNQGKSAKKIVIE